MTGVAIVGAEVFTGTGAVLESGTVVVQDDRIVDVHDDNRPGGMPAGFRTIDASGCWLLPGFIDAHTHLGYAHKASQDRNPDNALAVGLVNAQTKLETGVTTVRDVGAFNQLNITLRNSIDRGDWIGPRMLVSGDFLSTPGGHCHYWARQVSDLADAAQGAEEQMAAGADLIKVMASGGVADSEEDPNAPQLSEAQLSAIVDAARQAGRPVAAHAHPAGAITAAVTAGCSTIEHGTDLTPDVISLLIQHDVAVIPTVGVYDRLARGVDSPDPRVAELSRDVWDAKLPKLADAIAEGVLYGIGTDSGSNYPADGYVNELELMARLGIDSTEVLLSATSVNAQILGIDGEAGSIAAGLSADLVLIEENPLVNISNCRKVRTVLARGLMLGKDA